MEPQSYPDEPGPVAMQGDDVVEIREATPRSCGLEPEPFKQSRWVNW
jgi:hypothetical protein